MRFLVNGLPASLLAIRLGLADGAAIRRLAIDSLETTLQQDALTQITDQVAEWASDDDRRAQFQVIQDEVLAVSNQHGTTDSPVAVAAAAFVAGFVVGTLASEIYHHHIKHHDH